MMDTEGAKAAEARARALIGRAACVRRLTARELEVARLVALGLDNKEIASLIATAGRTVEAHLRHIFGKLEVDRRAAVAFLLAPMVLAEHSRAVASDPEPPDGILREARSAHHGGRSDDDHGNRTP